MATVPVPSLSLLGWVDAAAQKADLLISHIFEADKSQTYIYGKQVTSLQWIIEEYGSDILTVCRELRSAIESYLNRYYDTALVEVTSNDSPTLNTSSITLNLYCKVTEGGQEYSFGKLLEITDSKIAKIMNFNNNETNQSS